MIRGHRRATVVLLAIYVVAVCGFLLAPIVVAVILSFSSVPQLTFPPPGFSLHWYREAIGNEQFASGLWVSVVIAGSTSIISAIAGTGAAIAINHHRFRGRGGVQAFIMLPLALPGVVIGLNLLFALPSFGMKSGV